jgi:hypothetical protein
MWRARNFVGIVEQLWGEVPSPVEPVVQRILVGQSFVGTVEAIFKIPRRTIPMSAIYRMHYGENM